MKRLLQLLAVLSSFSLLFLNTRPAYACSAGPDFNAVEQSGIIVAGWLVDWQQLAASGGDAFIPIQVTMNVERAFKGTVSGQLQFVDRASLLATPSETSQWAGSSGACGVFDADPAGMYAILGLTRGEDGSYQSSRLLVFFLGTAPSGAQYEQAITRLAAGGVAPDAGQQDTTVTKTFTLTLYGNIPAGESFGVEYRDPVYPDRHPLVGYFCGPETQVACTGNGAVYTIQDTFPVGFKLHFRFFRGITMSPSFEQIREGWETLNSDMTNSAAYTFRTAAPNPGQPDMPAQLPDTGATELGIETLTGLGIAITLAVLGLALLTAGIPLVSARCRRR